MQNKKKYIPIKQEACRSLFYRYIILEYLNIKAKTINYMPIKQRAAAPTVKQSLYSTSMMKVLFAISLVLLPMLAMGQEVDFCCEFHTYFTLSHP